MIRSRFIVIVAALLVCTGSLAHGLHTLSRQRENKQRAEAHLAGLEAQLARQQQAQDDTQQELRLAEHQLMALSPAITNNSGEADRARDAEVYAWLAKIEQLHRLLDERPGHRIPEMKWIPDEEWLRIGRTFPLNSDDDIRRALAALRASGKHRFGSLLSAALRKFVDSGHTEMPGTVFALLPYFDDPAAIEALGRYEVTKDTSELRPTPRADWILRETAAVDAEYDSRSYLTQTGISTRYGLNAWIPHFRERFRAASQSYINANPGAAPAGISQLLPYFNPPFAPETAEKLIKAEFEKRLSTSGPMF